MTLCDASIVTDPFRANARPSSVELTFNEMLVKATILPCHAEALRVAALPTCQYTFWACAPLIRRTSPAVVIAPVTVFAWNTKVAFGLFCASSVMLFMASPPAILEKTSVATIVSWNEHDDFL